MLKLVELFIEYFYKNGIEPFLNRTDRWDKGFLANLDHSRLAHSLYRRSCMLVV